MPVVTDNSHGWQAQTPPTHVGRKGRLTPVQLVLMKQGQYRTFKPCGSGTPR